MPGTGRAQAQPRLRKGRCGAWTPCSQLSFSQWLLEEIANPTTRRAALASLLPPRPLKAGTAGSKTNREGGGSALAGGARNLAQALRVCLRLFPLRAAVGRSCASAVEPKQEARAGLGLSTQAQGFCPLKGKRPMAAMRMRPRGGGGRRPRAGQWTSRRLETQYAGAGLLPAYRPAPEGSSAHASSVVTQSWPMDFASPRDSVRRRTGSALLRASVKGQ